MSKSKKAEVNLDAPMNEEEKTILQDLLEALRTSPIIRLIVQQLIDNFFKVRKKAVSTEMPAMKSHCCDHKECCLHIVQCAATTLHCAVEHYHQCCLEEEHSHDTAENSE